MIPEAKLERTEHGLAPKGDGWYVLNLRDAEWRHAPGRGAVGVVVDDFEGWRRDVQFGVNPFVLAPGEAMGMYHRETDQESFLVVAGEAVLVVEGEERPLRAWDFFHCPAGAEHTVVGVGDGPCVVVAVGARDKSVGPEWGGYPVNETALRHRAGVERETTDAHEAYSAVQHREPTRYRDGWLP